MAKRKRSAGLTLEQVAQGIGLDVREVQDRLLRSGASALLGADGRVPIDALDAVVAKVKAAEGPILGGGLLADAAGLEALMQRSGVRRLEKPPAKPKPAGLERRAAPSPSASTAPAAPAELAAPDQGLAAAQRAAPSERPQAPPPTTTPPPRVSVIRGDLLSAPPAGGRRLDVLQEQLGEAERQISRLDAKLSAAGAREVELARQLSDMEFALEAQRARAIDLESRALAAARAPEPPPAPAAAPSSLTALLASRGLKGEDEAAAAIRALMDARRWEQIAAQLAPTQPEQVSALLKDRLLLHCGRESCVSPPAFVPVRVAPSRCEACGGGDLSRSLRRMSDALLLNGLRRVAVLGASPQWMRVLVERVDPRVELSAALPEGEGDAQVLLVWRVAAPSPLREGLSCLRSEAPSLAGFADDVTGALE